MKQLLRFMLLVAMMMVPWALWSQSFRFACDFEDPLMRADWITTNASAPNQWVVADGVNCTAEGAYGMYISNTGGTTHGYGAGSTFACVYREVTLSAGLYDLGYDWMCVGESESSPYYSDYYDYMRVALVPSSVEIPTERPMNNFYNSLPSGWIAVDGGKALCGESEWVHYAMELDVAEAGSYRLVFCWYNDNSGSDGVPAAIDNIVLKSQTCLKPTELRAEDIAWDGATIGWMENGGASLWRVEYGRSGFVRGSGEEVMVSGVSSCRLSGLESNTLYDVYVESVCGEGDVSRGEMMSFRTACGALSMPYMEDMEGYEANMFPYCWSLRNGQAKVYSFFSYAHSGVMSLEIKGDAVLLLPQLSDGVNGLGLYFAAKRAFETSGELEIGYVSDTSVWDYIGVRRIVPMDDDYHMYEVDFDDVEVLGENGYFVIRQFNTTSQWSSWYLDDIEIFELNDCRAPKDFVISEVTDCSALLEWGCNAEGATFEVRYADTIVETNVNRVVLTDLEGDRIYYPEVRSICNGVDTSYWQEMGFFRTDVVCAQVEMVKVDPILPTSAVVHWRYSSLGGDAMGGVLRYRVKDVGEWMEVMVEGNSYFMLDLNPGEVYELKLGVVCGEDTSGMTSLTFKTPTGNCGEIVGDEKVSYTVPLNGGNKYSYSESLYGADVVKGMDSIRGVAYHTTYRAQTRDITIYVGNTDKVKFEKVSEYVPYDAMTMVYDGEVAFTGAGWDTIMFDAPFATDGRNVVVCVTDQTGNSSSNKVKFYYHNGSSIYKNTNNGPIAPTDSYVKTKSEVPDVRFVGECSAATCVAPLLGYVEGTATSITFAWMAGLDESAWSVEYRAMGDEAWIMQHAYVTDTFVVLTDLVPGRGYELRVGSICGEDTVYAVAEGYTDCDVVEVPYFDNFDAGEINSCWRLHSVYPEGELPRIRNGELELPANSYVVMPMFGAPLTSLELHFKLDDVGKHVPLYVGVCKEMNNAMGFEVVDTVYMNSLDPNAEMTVHMNGYDGEGGYIALKSDIYPVYVDSLTVEYVSNCAKPTNIHMVDLGGTYMELAWDGGEMMTWKAKIVASGEDAEAVDWVNCGEPMVRFDQLQVNTLYDVYVVTECALERSVEVMTRMRTLHTNPLTLPYSTDFSEEDSRGDWDFYSMVGDNEWTIGGAALNGNANGLYVSDDEGATNHYNVNSTSAAVAYVPITIVEEGEYFISMDWKNAGKNNANYGRVALVPITYDFRNAPTSRFGYDNVLPMGWIAMDNGMMQDESTWQHLNRKQMIAEAGNYYLTFVWVNDGGGGVNPPMAIDNIVLSRFECSEPEQVVVSEITKNGATLSWSDNEMVEGGWEVRLNQEEPIVVEEPSYRFENLMMGMSYEASVRALCGEDLMSPMVNRVFSTLCGEIEELPYENNFDLVEEGSAPYCWNIDGEYPMVENGVLKFYCTDYGGSNKSVAVLPKIDSTIDMHHLELTFRAKNNSFAGNEMYVGVSTAMSGEDGLTIIDTLPLEEDWKDYLVTLNNYDGDGRYIVMKMVLGDNYFDETYVDDVKLEKASTCGRPMDAYIESYTHQSVTIKWSDTNSAATYRVAISSGNDLENPDELVEGIVEREYSFEDLAGGTNYQVWVSTMCSDTVSGWVKVGAFSTYPTCGVVENLKVIDVEEHRATLSWQNSMHGEEPTSYAVLIKDEDGDTINNEMVQVPYMFLNNLTTGETYTATVSAVCGDDSSVTSKVIFTPKALDGCNKIGDGTNAMSQAPVTTNSKYSLSQMIYTSEELFDMGDTIRGITFDKNNRSVFTRDVDVYMGVTDADDFANGWIDTVGMVKMYSGSWRLPEGDCSIDFETPFVRDPQRNVVVMINDHTNVSNSSSYFKYTVTEQEQTIYDCSGMANVTIASTRYTTSNNRPNITFDASCNGVSCTPPSVVVTDVSDVAVALAWRSGNDETEWEVAYRKAIDTMWTIVENTSTTEATITGLYPGTEYKMRVGSVCTENMAYRIVDVCTECGAMPLPFREDFENLDETQFEKICWTAGGKNYDVWEDQSPVVEHRRGQSNMLFMYNDAWVALPQMQGSLNELQMRVRCWAEADTTYAIVGYMESANQLSTFHPVDTIYDNNNIMGEYHEIDFGALGDDCSGYMAIYVPSQAGYLYIDDIMVEPIRSCVTPTDVAVDNITSTTARVSWSGSATNYSVAYGETAYDGQEMEYATVAVAGNSVVLDDLNAGVTYDVIVSAVCGEGDTSYRSNAYTFTTECSAIVELPYVMNFELGYLLPKDETNVVPNCWEVAYVDSVNSLEKNYPQIIRDRLGNHVKNGTHALRMVEKSIVALPAMEMDVDTLCLKFYNKVTDMNSRIVVGVLDYVGEGCESTFESIDTIVPENINVFEPYVVYFDGYRGSGKYLAIRNIDIDNSKHQSTQYFDSIVVDYVPSCIEVSDVKAIAQGANSITIDWTSHDESVEAWQVSYGNEGFELGTGNSVVVSEHPVMIVGLDAMTAYDVWVRPICGDGDTGSYGLRALHVSTLMCDSPMEISTSINGSTGTSSNYPFGVFYGHSYSQTIIDSSYFASGASIMAFKFTDSKASNDCMNSCHVWMGHTTKSKFDTTNDWVDADDLQLVYTGDMTYDAGEVMIVLDSAFNYNGTSNLIIAIDRDDGDYDGQHNYSIVNDAMAKTLWQHSDYQNQDPYDPLYSGTLENGHAAFEFVVCGENTCDVPVLGAVTPLENESATIHWSGAGLNYEVAISEQQNANVITPIAIEGNEYVFDGLMPGVTYVYYVRQVCGEQMYSDWVEGGFTTTNIPPCYKPENVHVEHVGYRSVTMTWDAAEGQGEWCVHVFNNQEDYWDTVVENPCTIVGLNMATEYKVAVKTLCLNDNSSEWSDSVVFSTMSCDPISELQITDITEHSAKISWSAVEGQSEWEINYGESAFGQGEGVMVSSTETYYVITALEPATTYDVYVRAKCGEQVHSVWSEVEQFTTLTPVCEMPMGLTAMVTEDSVTLDWETAEHQTKWEVSMTMEGGEEMLRTVTTHPVTIGDLEVGDYGVKVRTICSDELYSEWSDMVEFSIEEALVCEPASEVEVSDITEHSAKVSWIGDDATPNWEVVYGEVGFDYNTAESITIAAKEYRIMNLEEHTRYDVYVRAVCGEGLYSEWSEKVTFETMESQEGIDAVDGDIEFMVYPNPTHGWTMINLNGVEGKVLVNIIDMNGRTVISTQMNCVGDSKKKIDINSLSQGTYFVRAVGDRISSVRKLIVR